MRQALEDLIEVVEAAINAGDWKVDGACEPTMALIRAKKALAQAENKPPNGWNEDIWKSVTENGMYRLGYHNGYGFGEAYGKANAIQQKPLSENEIKHFWYEACQTNLELTSQLIVHLARNIEAAHGIKE